MNAFLAALAVIAVWLILPFALFGGDALEPAHIVATRSPAALLLALAIGAAASALAWLLIAADR